MAKSEKSSASKKAGKKEEGKKEEGKRQDLLMKPPEGTFKQGKIDGSGTLRETASKEIQDAAEYWFGKKIEEGRAKDNAKKAGEKLLQLMEYEKKTSVLVFNSDLQKKVRVNIIEGAEKLRVEKNVSE